MNFLKAYCLVLLLALSVQIKAQYPAPKVRYTSYNINTGKFEIRWDSSTAPIVDFYKIWYYYPARAPFTDGWKEVIENKRIYSTSDLFLSFDPSGLTNANPLAEPVIFGVQAFIQDSIKRNVLEEWIFDSTIYLQAEYDSCLESLSLSWNRYTFKQWNQPGTSEYQLMISDDGGTTFSLYTSLPPDTRNYEIKGLAANNDYILYVSAIAANNPGDRANSTPVYINTNMAVLPDFMYVNYASYNKGLIDMSFTIDPKSETSTYNLLRSTEPNSNYASVHQFTTSEKEFSYTDNANYLASPYYYKLEVVNYCEVNIRESENTASTVLLKANGTSLQPELNWNEYINWPGSSNLYAVERRFGNPDFNEITTLTNTSFTDSEIQSLIEMNYASEVCYQIVAHENGGSFSSTSNPVCYNLPVNIRFEFDAFMPGSANGNNTFGPTIDFVPDEYVFKVVDRVGRKVYESKDPANTRWDGYINGSLAPLGAYLCLVQYRIGNEKRQTISGSVVVVY
jgi:hypothetical protein